MNEINKRKRWEERREREKREEMILCLFSGVKVSNWYCRCHIFDLASLKPSCLQSNNHDGVSCLSWLIVHRRTRGRSSA